MNEELCCGTMSLELKYNRNEERQNSNTVLIFNPDIIKDLPSYALADYSNEEAMELSHKRHAVYMCFIVDGFYICCLKVIMYSVRVRNGLSGRTLEYVNFLLYVCIFASVLYIQMSTSTKCIEIHC